MYIIIKYKHLYYISFLYIINLSLGNNLNLTLDIGKRYNYNNESYKLNYVSWNGPDYTLSNYNLFPPIELSKFVFNNTLLTSDLNILKDRIIANVTVYWYDNIPLLLQIYSNNSILYLYNYVGRLLIQGELKCGVNLFTINPTHYIINIKLDLSKQINYINENDNKLINVTIDDIKFSPFTKITHYIPDNKFKVTSITNDKYQIKHINIPNELFKHVHLYKFYNDILLLEFITFDNKYFIFQRNLLNQFNLIDDIPHKQSGDNGVMNDDEYVRVLMDLLNTTNVSFNNVGYVDISKGSLGIKRYKSTFDVEYMNKLYKSKLEFMVLPHSSGTNYNLKCFKHFRNNNKNKPYIISSIVDNQTNINVPIPNKPIYNTLICHNPNNNKYIFIEFITEHDFYYTIYNKNSWQQLKRFGTEVEHDKVYKLLSS